MFVSDSQQVYAPWRRWVELWYVAYALFGTTATGIIPIVVPLAISRHGNAADMGMVMAAISLGGLTAPFWGGLADRYRLHRWLLAGGFTVTAVGLALFPFTTTTAAWLGLALLQGLGVAGASTVANLFVVEVHPEAEWDERIAWLHTFYDGGQVSGLLLAAWVSQTDLRLSLLMLAGGTLVAAWLGWWATQTPPVPLQPRPVLLRPVQHGEWTLGSPQRHYHHLGWQELQWLGMVLRTPFSLFLATWLISFIGSSAFFAFYPVLMQQVFGMAAWLSSSVFALAVGLRLLLYAATGHWSETYGPVWVLRAALGVRLLAFLTIFSLRHAPASSQSILALLSVTCIVLPWSLFSVSSTALTAHLSPVGTGTGMGMLNATTAIAGMMGAMVGGWLAVHWGYHAVLGLAVAGLAVGLVLACRIRLVS
jgi:MFS family permease